MPLVRAASSSRETSPGSDEDEEEEADDDDDDGVLQDKDVEDDKGQFYAATIPIQLRDIEDLKEYDSVQCIKLYLYLILLSLL